MKTNCSNCRHLLADHLDGACKHCYCLLHPSPPPPPQNLRQTFLDLGLNPKDLDEAVDAARDLTRTVRGGANVAASFLRHVGEKKAKPGSKTQLVALLASTWAEKLRDNADVLLSPTRKKP